MPMDGARPTEASARVDLRLVPAALAAWGATASAITWPVGNVTAVLCVVVGAAAGGVLWIERHQQRSRRRLVATGVLAVAIVAATFSWSAAVRADAVRQHPIAALAGSSTLVTVVADEQPRPLRGGGRVMFRAALARIGTDEVNGRVVVFAPARDFAMLTPGRPASFRAEVSRPLRRDLSVAVLNAAGRPTLGEASALQRAAQRLRARFADSARVTLPPDQAAVLPALVLGDTSTLAPEVVARFRRAGLTHLTAVSGANVTIVCGTLLLTAGLWGPRVAVVLAGIALSAFVVVVGPSASVLRAAVMGAIALLGVLSHRRRQAVPALAATVIALLIVAPELAVDAGFALSVSATAALVTVAPVWSSRLVARGWPKLLADAVCVAAVAQLVTAPLIAGISGQVSLVSVLANVAVSPVIPPITVLGTAAAALCPMWADAARILIRFTGPELWWLLTVAQWAGGMPGATMSVPSRLSGFSIVALAGIGVVLLSRMLPAALRRALVARSPGEFRGPSSGAGRRGTARRARCSDSVERRSDARWHG